MFTEALLAFNLYIQEMRDRVEHPKELTIETRVIVAEATISLGNTNSITYTIRFKNGRPNRHHRMGGLE